MANGPYEQPPDPALSQAIGILRYLGNRNLVADLSWILTGYNDPDTPAAGYHLREDAPITPTDLARVHPEVVQAAREVVGAAIEAGDALSALTAARGELYKTFAAAKAGEEHREGEIDMSNVNTIDDL